MAAFLVSLVFLSGMSVVLVLIMARADALIGWKLAAMCLIALSGAVLGNYLLPVLEKLIHKYVHFYLVSSLAGAYVFYLVFRKWL